MLSSILARNRSAFHPIVPFDPVHEEVLELDLSETNTALTSAIFDDTDLFTAFIIGALEKENARYGVGGYLENRKVYARSRVFDAATTGEEARTLHLGIDIWGKAGTEVMAPLAGKVHSTGNHPEYGNYGATIILQHALEGVTFYTLFGHLSFADLAIQPGQELQAGEIFAHFGAPEENGHWPPHLHLQVIADLEGFSGDYPGVCAPSKMEHYRSNCPHPGLLLKF